MNLELYLYILEQAGIQGIPCKIKKQPNLFEIDILQLKELCLLDYENHDNYFLIKPFEDEVKENGTSAQTNYATRNTSKEYSKPSRNK